MKDVRNKPIREMIMIFILGGMVSASLIFVTTYRKVPDIMPKNLTDTVQDLRKYYDDFRSMSGLQLHHIHSQLFFYSKYKIDGKVRENEYDCAGAETVFWRTLGGNVEYEDTELKEQRLRRVSKPHQSINTVKIGDIIIFKRAEKYGHIAVIEDIDKQKKTLRYMDMNVAENGPGYNVISFSDSRIQAIYPMSFDYYCGNILSKFDGR